MLIACGAALFVYLVLRIGPATVVESFRSLSWRLLVVIVFPCVVLKMFDALAWRFAFPDAGAPLLSLSAGLLAGQAVASITPSGALGEKAVMGWMLRDRMSLREGLSSLLVVQTTSTISQGLFLLLGVVLARWTLSSSLALVRAMGWLLLLEVIGVAGFVVVQVRGGVAGGYGLLGRLGLSGGAGVGETVAHVDRALLTFYRSHPRRLAMSLGCSFLGWVTRSGETWFILYLLGASVSVPMALIIESFETGISFATFFLPTDLGVQEGGIVATFLALGLSGAIGLSFSLVRRIRDLAWTALGLLLLAGKGRPSPVAARTQQA